MTFTLTHAAGDMFAPTAKRHAMYRQITQSGADVVTFSEAAKDHAFIESLPGFDWAMVSEIIIGWRTSKFTRLGPPIWAKVMDGGRRGPLGSRRKNRRGPNRYGVTVPLLEIATSDEWSLATHHAIAKADTSFLWRRPLRAQGFKGFADVIRRGITARPSALVVATGDWNTKRGVNLGLGLREIPTGATFGRGLRYDRVQVGPGVHSSRAVLSETPLDHKAVTVVLSAEPIPGEIHIPAPAPAPAAAPPGKRPPRNPWRRFSRRWRRRHPRRWRRILRRWRRRRRNR